MDVRSELQSFIREPAARRDPRRLYDRLVREAPVLAADDTDRAYYISGYDEIVALAKNPAAVTDFSKVGVDIGQGLNYADLLTKMLPLRSGADHTRLRRLATTTFSARTTNAIRPLILDTVTELLKPHLSAGRLEVVTDLARPLPVAVSCALLDIPTADRPLVGRWAAQITGSLWRDGAEDPIDVAPVRDYIQQLCAERRAHPGEDLISQLVAAHTDGVVDDDELIAFVLMLFVNGLDTLTSGLSGAVWHAVNNPEVLASLAGQPRTAEAVFDECLRLAGPVRASSRVLLADVTVGGQRLSAGTAVVLLYAAANRDPRYFPDPDRLLPGRDARHLAFGFGAHYCLGAPISLVAGGAVLRLLAEYCPDARTPFTADTAPWNTSLPFAGLDELPLSFSTTPSLIAV